MVDIDIKYFMGQSKEDIPGELFKFISFDDNIGLNCKKIQSIKEDFIWLSRYDCLNDPFDGDGMKYDLSNPDHNTMKGFADETRGKTFVSCFTSDIDNLPMWAHYANNYKGICIKFEVIDSNNFSKVIYKEDRTDVDTFVDESYKIKQKLEDKIISQNDLIKENAIKIFFQSMITKNSAWKYENEYRIISRLKNNSSDKGGYAGYEEMGIKAKEIYIGINCDEELIERLVNIAEYKKYNVFKMKISNEKYGFEWEKII